MSDWVRVYCKDCNKLLGKWAHKNHSILCPSCAKKGFRNPRFGVEGNKKEKSWNWSRTPSYRALHKRIENELGTPMKCEHCRTTTATRYHWANVSKKYKYDLKDWIRLCTKCHSNFDNNYPPLQKGKHWKWKSLENHWSRRTNGI